MKNRRIPGFLCLTGLVCSFGNRVTSAWVGFKEEKSGRISLFFVCFALLCSNINRRHRLDGVQLWISSLVISTQTAFEAFAKKISFACLFFFSLLLQHRNCACTNARTQEMTDAAVPASPALSARLSKVCARARTSTPAHENCWWCAAVRTELHTWKDWQIF